MITRRARAALILAAAAVALPVSAAVAHIQVSSSNPKAGATVKVLPKTITATFTTVLLKVGTPALIGPDGKNHAVGARLDPTKKTRVLVTTKNSTPGRYTLSLTVTGSDAHSQKVSFSFRVRS